MTNCNYSKEVLIDCLIGEFLESGEAGLVAYQEHLSTLTLEQLVDKTGCDDDEWTLDDFVYAYS